MDVINIAAKLFVSKAKSDNGSLYIGAVISGLKGLLPMHNNDLDMARLMANFSRTELASLAGSWLGNGGNQRVSVQQITQLFGQQNIASFASQIGIQNDKAASGLAAMIPELIDKSSENGSFVDNIKSELGRKVLGGFF